MATFRLRVELPDRPGAVGAVASRMGAVRGDVVSVEVVERRGGCAVDEFVVELPDGDHLRLLLSEVSEVDGVRVEEVHPLSEHGRDRSRDPYDTAVALLQEHHHHGVLTALAARAAAELDGAWAAVLDVEDGILIAGWGRPPAAPWLVAYVEDTRGPVSGGAPRGPGSGGFDGEWTPGRPHSGDIAWVDLAAWDLVLLGGRPGWRMGDGDRARLAALARLADARWVDLAERDARRSHPTRAG
jgi:hypothetical protein